MNDLALGRLIGALAIAAAACCTPGCRPVADNAAAASVDQRTNDWTVPGVLRIESAGKPDNLNPIIGQESIDTDLAMFWGGHLFDWDDAGRFVPELATVVPTLANGGISADGRTIVYHLRRGVLWQDGKPFDARDVIFSWQAVMNPRNDVPVREGYDLIDRIDARDPYTIAVHLRRPYAPFVSTFFSMSDTAYGVLPAHLLSGYRDLNDIGFDRMPIGTGPFRVVYNDGERIRLDAFPRYWRGTPKLRRVEFHWVASNSAILNHLKQHAIDFYYGAYERQEPQLSGIAGTTVYLYPFNSYEDIGFNTQSPVVGDKRVRQALAYATDRRELTQTVDNGVDSVADSDQPAFSWAHADHLAQYSFNPKHAAALLDETGWRVGPGGVRRKDGRPLRIVLVSGAGPGPPGPIETLVEKDWRAVGVDLVVHNYGADDLDAPGNGIEASGRFDAVLESWVNGTDPDDSSQFLCSLRPPSGWNYYRLCDPALDAAEIAALTSYDVAVRKRAYDRIQAILADDEPIIVLYFVQNQDVVNLDLKNYRPASAVTPFWNPWELEI